MNFNSKKILYIRIVLLVIGLILTVVIPPWKLTLAWVNPFPSSIQEEVNQAPKYGFDGIMAYVDVAGKDPEAYTAGWHNKEKKIEAYPEALFKIGSIDKLYNAIAVTKLINNGDLSLDGTISEYLPDLPVKIDNSEKITLRMMIQHRSGIPNFTDTPRYWEFPPESNELKLKLIQDLPANFDPDSEYQYSNTNYLLISMIMNETLGYNHEEFIKAEIIDKLELNNTYFSLSQIETESLMSGYYVGIEEDIKTTNYGSMISNMEDTAKLIRALNNGSIFNEAEKEIYPYVYDHDGLLPGYQVFSKYHEYTDSVTILVLNTTDFSDYQNLGIPNVIHDRIISKLERSAERD